MTAAGSLGRTHIGRGAARRLAGAIAALSIAALGLAACGGSSGGGGGGHDSPDGAVKGLVDALQGWDGSANGINNVLDWIAPSQRQTAKDSLQTAANLGVKFQFKFDSFDTTGDQKVDDNHVKVGYKGKVTVCTSGGPAGSTQSCTNEGLSPTGEANQVDTVREGGQWYVSSLSGGNGSSSSSSSSSATGTDTGGGASSTDTGAGTPTDTSSSSASSS